MGSLQKKQIIIEEEKRIFYIEIRKRGDAIYEVYARRNKSNDEIVFGLDIDDSYLTDLKRKRKEIGQQAHLIEKVMEYPSCRLRKLFID